MQLLVASSILSINIVQGFLLRGEPTPAANQSHFVRLGADYLVYDEQVSAAAAACDPSTATCRMLRAMRVCGSCAGGAGQLERLGAPFDGGYVTCADAMANAKSALSLGINGVDDWGITVSEDYGLPVNQYDCTNPKRPLCPSTAARCELHFFDECLEDGSRKMQPAKTLAQMLARPDVAVPPGDVMLKMDVESAEWGSFKNADLATLRRFNQIAVEFHGLRQMHRHQEFATVVEKLLQAFVVVHTHGNTCCGNFNFKGFTVPNTFEVTFVRKDSAKALPTCLVGRPNAHLDMPNHRGRQELPVKLPA